MAGREAAWAAAVVFVAVLVVAGTAATGDGGAAAPSGLGPQGRVPQFVAECAWSHAARVDPIVHPGERDAGHLHDFFGNTSTAATSTYASLTRAETTCDQQLDTAAYWAPALYTDRTRVAPVGSTAYYRPGPGVDPATVLPYPPGLKMLGGNADPASVPNVASAAWHCGTSPTLSTEPPTCPEHAPLGVRVVFPDCWDGRRLDAADHRSHMTASARGACPATHPVPVPQLVFEIRYDLWGPGHEVELASGGVRSVHADFVNTWDQAALEREVHACLNRGKICGVVSRRATG
jgi:hypothetical protein